MRQRRAWDRADRWKHGLHHRGQRVLSQRRPGGEDRQRALPVRRAVQRHPAEPVPRQSGQRAAPPVFVELLHLDPEPLLEQRRPRLRPPRLDRNAARGRRRVGEHDGRVLDRGRRHRHAALRLHRHRQRPQDQRVRSVGGAVIGIGFRFRLQPVLELDGSPPGQVHQHALHPRVGLQGGERAGRANDPVGPAVHQPGSRGLPPPRGLTGNRRRQLGRAELPRHRRARARADRRPGHGRRGDRARALR